MVKKILMLCPNNRKGSPANERFLAYVNCFEKKGFDICIYDFPLGFLKELQMLFCIFKERPDYIFISQPPFRFWILFLVPFLKIILDVRDGWGASIKSGYGGAVKLNKIKYFIVSKLEDFMFFRSYLIITCTTGLKEYIQNKCNKDVILLTNGVSRRNFNLISEKSKLYGGQINNLDTLNFSCAGQFSEYGKEHIKKIIEVISSRYSNKKCVINVYGADISLNLWVHDFIKKYNNVDFILHPRLSQENLYTELAKTNIFISVIRDPLIDYGTKVFEYIAFNRPILNYFDEINNFVNYFDGSFDVNNNCEFFNKSIIRESLIEENEEIILEKLK